ncbi:unnamed protein product, partial [Staurois parvus]
MTSGMITDWPIRDHMNRDLVQRSHTAIVVPHAPRERAQAVNAGGPFINGHPLRHCSRAAIYVHGQDRKCL